MKKILFILLLLYSTSLIAGTLKGKIVDKKTGKAIPNVDLVVEKDGIRCAVSHTDYWGKYSIKGLVPGKYNLYASISGMEEEVVEEIIIVDGLFIYVDLEMKELESLEPKGNEKEEAAQNNKLSNCIKGSMHSDKLAYERRIPASRMRKRV